MKKSLLKTISVLLVIVVLFVSLFIQSNAIAGVAALVIGSLAGYAAMAVGSVVAYKFGEMMITADWKGCAEWYSEKISNGVGHLKNFAVDAYGNIIDRFTNTPVATYNDGRLLVDSNFVKALNDEMDNDINSENELIFGTNGIAINPWDSYETYFYSVPSGSTDINYIADYGENFIVSIERVHNSHQYVEFIHKSTGDVFKLDFLSNLGRGNATIYHPQVDYENEFAKIQYNTFTWGTYFRTSTWSLTSSGLKWYYNNEQIISLNGNLVAGDKILQVGDTSKSRFMFRHLIKDEVVGTLITIPYDASVDSIKDLPITNTSVGDIVITIPESTIDELADKIGSNTLTDDDVLNAVKQGVLDATGVIDTALPFDPPIIGNIDDTTNRLKLPRLMLTKFPFSIPADILGVLSLLSAEPEAPKFDIPLIVGQGLGEHELTIDLSQFEMIAKIFRIFIILIFIVGLAWATKSMLF